MRNRGMLLLLTTGWMAIAAPARGQVLHASGPLPSYEVATIKPLAARVNGYRPRCQACGVTARELIKIAYNVPFGTNQVIGGPGWIDNERYDIDGKMDEASLAAFRKMPDIERNRQSALLLQSLMADRFKLKVHFETREMPIYALVVAKGGSKLIPAKEVAPTARSPATLAANTPPPIAKAMQGTLRVDDIDIKTGTVMLPDGPGRMAMVSKGTTLDSFANFLMSFAEVDGRKVVDQTGLTGKYDLKLRWAREQSTMAEPDAAQPSSVDVPEIFKALEEQLGLKLEPAKGPVEVVVIDHIERPSEN